MADTPTIRLAGVPVTTQGLAGWVQTCGVAAPFQTYVVHESVWSQIESRLGTFTDLTGDISWQRLFLVRETVTSLPFHRAVVVSDVRYLWNREIVVRSMNIPRKTGDKRIVGGEIVELQTTVDVFKYARASLNDEGERWLPKEAVESVLAELATKCDHPYKIESMPFKEDRELTVEGIEFSDPGDVALGRLLMHIPHAEITIDRDGTARVFDGTLLDASESRMESVGPPTEAGQIDRLVELDAIRPSEINVYFAKEVELRFDSSEEGGSGKSNSVEPEPEADEPMTMDNVLPLPDVYTEIRGSQFAQGTYVRVDEALAAWNEDLPSLGKNPPQLTLDNVRKHWWVLESLYAPLGDLTLQAAKINWAARIATLRQHYRQTFQINPKWMERIRDLIPFRVGILDPVSGARAPSQTWSQYCIEPSSKMYTLTKLTKDPDLQYYWMNVDSYPGEFGELHSKAPSPALVQIVDRDLGVLHINYQSDRFQNRSNIHPSMLREGQAGKVVAPTRDLSRQLFDVIAKDGRLTGTGKGMPLADDFRVAILITAMPFSPNNESRYLRWSVEPDDVTPSLSERFKVKNGRGRPWHIFIPPTLMTAWYAHQETAPAKFGAARLFGLIDVPPGEDTNVVEGYRVINDEAMIPSMARAAAVAQWAAFVNQREGTRAVHLDPSVKPLGGITTVAHRVGSDGRQITEISMPTARRPVSQLAFIPQEMRPKILGEVPRIKP